MKDDRLISLNAAIDALWHSIECENGGELQSYAEAVVGDAEDVLKALPIVDAVPVRHGRWIIKDNPGTGWYRVTCSECGEDVTSVAPVIGFFPKAKVSWDFCPNCGARMDGKDDDNG